MKSDDSGTITPADIEEKLKDFKSELLSMSGGFSFAKGWAISNDASRDIDTRYYEA